MLFIFRLKLRKGDKAIGGKQKARPATCGIDKLIREIKTFLIVSSKFRKILPKQAEMKLLSCSSYWEILVGLTPALEEGKPDLSFDFTNN